MQNVLLSFQVNVHSEASKLAVWICGRPAAEHETLRQEVCLEFFDTLNLTPGLNSSRPLQTDIPNGIVGTNSKVVNEVCCDQDTCSSKSSVTMHCYLALADRKCHDLDHVQQVWDRRLCVVLPRKVVEKDAVAHELVGIVSEAGVEKVRAAACVLAGRLQVYHGSNPEVQKLVDQLELVHGGCVWAGHSKLKSLRKSLIKGSGTVD